ncbi:helix-turn-helix domain-containing protein [Streptomyces drozdowiczii]|uniref:AraC family transcriptional regulator n=1 Tax=Streptomyces drozdowiczii TaxID=202862 RepID=A0ABY6PRJ8_9ACTN|nr:AraC family transcriptional regulator [Streptomyces drozdowiczii]MCX0245789.1 AraC family transcriptional regulator [Streptomyces drozdowiczii]UZK54614.1 AraC family transcriptional regulator [Streptomyces drozdowiczii]
MVRSQSPEVSPGLWRREAGTVVRRAGAPPERATDSGAVVAEFRIVPAPTEWAQHAHRLHELVWVRGGTLTSRVGDRVFTVFEGHGLWMPAGVVHAGRATEGARFHSAFFAPDRTPFAYGEPKAIAMTPLLVSLLTHLSRTDLDEGARLRAEAVVFDVIEPSEHQLALRLPGDPRIDAIAEALLDDPADGRSLEEWARWLGTSDRTITRAFRQSTGLSFAQWRQMLRVHRALMLLSDGFDVMSVSEQLGYAQPSSFIAAFRRVMGTTPGAFSGSAESASRDVRNSVSGGENAGLSA